MRDACDYYDRGDCLEVGAMRVREALLTLWSDY